ncbi:MAG TPA: metallophosphoesterase family protein [Polyangiaceae bacterium]|jgi:serine/threonine protein phosphatase 1|nr:metallophosphoesterase family protein [Polyangiaceae bacterium]
MARRTFAIGDIHGETSHLFKVLASLPKLTEEDTLVFLGDYVDRGPSSAQVVDYVRKLPGTVKAKVVALRGNHEDAWLRVIERGWNAFVAPPGNGCLAAMRSYTGGAPAKDEELPTPEERPLLESGKFFPADVVEWFRTLPFWYEDEHAIYVHAGLPRTEKGFLHPSEVPEPLALLWMRDEHFFRSYRGKLVVFGHTRTEYLPPELSGYTPEDPTDLWAGENVVGIDTGCGNGGFLTALELPALNVYESRH